MAPPRLAPRMRAAPSTARARGGACAEGRAAGAGPRHVGGGAGPGRAQPASLRRVWRRRDEPGPAGWRAGPGRAGHGRLRGEAAPSPGPATRAQAGRPQRAAAQGASQVEERLPHDGRAAAQQARRVLGHGARLRGPRRDLGRAQGGRRRRGGQRPRPGPGHPGRRQHHPASRLPDRVLRRAGEPVPAARVLPGAAREPHPGARRGRGPRGGGAGAGRAARVPAEGAAVDGPGRAAGRQHGRHGGAAQAAAAGPRGHRARLAALVLLGEAADGPHAPAGHAAAEGLCGPGHREPAAAPQELTRRWARPPGRGARAGPGVDGHRGSAPPRPWRSGLHPLGRSCDRRCLGRCPRGLAGSPRLSPLGLCCSCWSGDAAGAAVQGARGAGAAVSVLCIYQ